MEALCLRAVGSLVCYITLYVISLTFSWRSASARAPHTGARWQLGPCDCEVENATKETRERTYFIFDLCYCYISFSTNVPGYTSAST